MTLRLIEAPFFRPVIALIVGVLSQQVLRYSAWLDFLFASLALFLLVLLLKAAKAVFLNTQIFRGAIVYFLFVFIGHALAMLTDQYHSDIHFVKTKTADSYFLALDEVPLQSEKSIKAKATVYELIDSGGALSKATGRVLVYFEKDSASMQLQYGSLVLYKGKLLPTIAPQNPHEFNYKKYLAYQNIRHQAFVKSYQWKTLDGFKGNVLFAEAQKVTSTFLHILNQKLPDPEVLGVAKALILGFTKELNDEIVSAYSSTGAMHVLAVSGMHVAIVMVVFTFLTKFILRLKSGKQIQAFITIMLLWAYAFITGLSPSVMRAATMFSFVLFGKAIGQNTNTYNSLFVSAFVLICINPFIIFQVGFQLSYMAVIGIVFFTPLIYERIWFKNRIMDQTWQLFSVSIAAQLITFPLGLLYFHQFPNLFFISNLLIIPLTAPILYGGLALLAFAEVPYLSDFLSFGVGGLIQVCNFIVKYIEFLPHSQATGVVLNIFQTWVMYAIIGSFAFYLLLRKAIHFYFMLAFTTVLLISKIYFFEQEKSGRYFHVYQVKKASVFDVLDGKQALLFADSNLNYNKFDFHIKQNWWIKGHNTPKKPFWAENDTLFQKTTFSKALFFNDLKILQVFGKEAKRLAFKDKRQFDFVLLSYNPRISFTAIHSSLLCKKIIIDSSNSNAWIKRFISSLTENERQQIHIVSQDGSFIYDYSQKTKLFETW